MSTNIVSQLAGQRKVNSQSKVKNYSSQKQQKPIPDTFDDITTHNGPGPRFIMVPARTVLCKSKNAFQRLCQLSHFDAFLEYLCALA